MQAITVRRRCAGWRYQSLTAPKRPLGIPTVKDRVCQQAAKIVLEPIFEADFLPCSFGFRPKRSATDALEKLRVGFIEGNCFVFEADITDFFGSIDHEKLFSLVAERVSDRRVLKLLATVVACWGVGRRGGLRDGHGDASRRGHLPAPGQHLPARLRPGLGRARHRRSSSAMRTTSWCCAIPGAGRASPASEQLRYWASSA